MDLIQNLYSQIIRVFSDGVFGVSLGDLLIIIIAVIFSLLIRSFVARVLVNKVKTLVFKTGNKIDDKLFYMLTDRHRMVLRNILIAFCLLLLADLRGD